MNCKELQASIRRMVNRIKALPALRAIYQLAQKYFLRQK